jgi:predicted nucleic acid-binding protein
MCLVIDINVIGSVFNPKAEYHPNFEPVYNWIVHGKGKIIWGGTTYRDELRSGKYLRLLTRLNNSRKTVKIDPDNVDEIEVRLKNECCGSEYKGFNDHHIVALIIASKCKLICTGDNESDRFLKNGSLYPSGVGVPSIYKDINHRHLITDDKIVKECLPDKILTKEERNSLFL